MFKKVKLQSPLRDNEILSVSNLTCIYDENTTNKFIALDKINYVFQKNKIYCIIGDSGSGKSTLVTHFNGLLVSKYGDIWVKDIHLGGKKKKIKNFKKLRKIISMVFQFPEYQLFKDTIEHDIMFGPVALGVKKRDAQLLAEKYLNQIGLDNTYLERSPFELSGGQKRRVAIAGILAIQSEIIIFDEPTAGLDPHGEDEMMKIIKEEKAANKTVIVITHQMEKVLEIADEILVLSKGKIIKSGKPYEIFTDKNLLDNSSIDVPPVIKVINDLVKKNNVFNKLYEYEPRNVQDLSNAIQKIINGSYNV